MQPDLGILFGLDPFGDVDAPADFAAPAAIAGGDRAPELCQLADRWSVALHPDQALGDVKLDGWRALYIGGPLVSREGIPMRQAAHSYRALQELERAYGKPMFFDGEYTHPEGVDACGRPGGTIWLFDAVPLEVWRANAPSAPLIHRRELLLERGQHCFGPALGALKPRRLGSAREAIAFAEELWRLGYEGEVVKAANSLYERRRSSRWLKIKQWRTERFRIADAVVSGGMLDLLIVIVEGRSQRLNVRYLPKAVRAALASTVRPHDIALVEHAGFTSKGALRDATFQGIADGD